MEPSANDETERETRSLRQQLIDAQIRAAENYKMICTVAFVATVFLWSFATNELQGDIRWTAQISITIGAIVLGTLWVLAAQRSRYLKRDMDRLAAECRTAGHPLWFGQTSAYRPPGCS